MPVYRPRMTRMSVVSSQIPPFLPRCSQPTHGLLVLYGQSSAVVGTEAWPAASWTPFSLLFFPSFSFLSQSPEQLGVVLSRVSLGPAFICGAVYLASRASVVGVVMDHGLCEMTMAHNTRDSGSVGESGVDRGGVAGW